MTPAEVEAVVQAAELMESDEAAARMLQAQEDQNEPRPQAPSVPAYEPTPQSAAASQIRADEAAARMLQAQEVEDQTTLHLGASGGSTRAGTRAFLWYVSGGDDEHQPCY